MRRYMIWAALAVSMLATACTVADGNMEREPISVGRQIAREANQRLSSTNQTICWALAADAYLTTDDEDVKTDIYVNIFRSNLRPQLSENRDTVSLVFESGTAYYRYTTNGLLLSEGGEWKAWYDITISAQESGVIEVRNNPESGENTAANRYKLDIQNVVMDNFLSYDISGSVYFIYNNEGSKALSIEIDDTLSYTSKRRRTHYDTRDIGFCNGIVKAVYTDSYAGYNDEVTMTYGEESDNSIVVDYLGQRGSIDK